MAALKSLDAALVARFGARVFSSVEAESGAPDEGRFLASAWPELDALLPDGGLPVGVVELSAPGALGGATTVALAAVRAAQRRESKAWCAWVDGESTLYGPGVAAAGVDLGRLLVVRPPFDEVPRTALKVAQAQAFDVVVVDVHAKRAAPRPARGRRTGMAPEVLVRKLALAADEGGATVLLLSDAREPKAMPWPVALRLELRREGPDTISLRVAKDRRGRIGLAKTVPLATRPREVG
jgi:hypothetical protein